MRYTHVDWIDAEKEMPSTEEFGPYPCVHVALACKGHPEFGYQIRMAELRFFGGDKRRPYWSSFKGEGHSPIENTAWFVKYWAPPFKQPNANHD